MQIRLLGLLAVSVVACSTASEERESETGSAIVDGRFVDAPWFALVETPNVRCSGVVLDDRRVLTAKHCVKDASTAVVVMNGERFVVDHVHEAEATNTEGEIALLVTAEGLPAGPRPSLVDRFPAEARFVAIGRIAAGQDTSRAVASASFDCALNPSGLTCGTRPQVTEHGDSGGPLVVANDDGSPSSTLIGLAWGGLGESGWHVVSPSIVSALEARPWRPMHTDCDTACTASPDYCLAGTTWTTCAAFGASLPACGFGCTFDTPGTPRTWRCDAFGTPQTCRYDKTCGDYASDNHLTNVRCERDGNAACGGQGAPTLDCDHCCN